MELSCLERLTSICYLRLSSLLQMPLALEFQIQHHSSHIEVAPILTLESCRPVNPLTGLDSNQSHAFPLSAKPLGLGRNSLSTPTLATMDFRVLKYFPFGGVKRLDW